MAPEPKINVVKYEFPDAQIEGLEDRTAISYQVVIGSSGGGGLCVGEARARLFNKRCLLEMTRDNTDTSHAGEGRRFSEIMPGIVDSRDEAHKVLARYARMYAHEVNGLTGLEVHDLTIARDRIWSGHTG